MGCLENTILFDEPGAQNGNYGETLTWAYGPLNVSVDDTEISNFVPLGAPHCIPSVGSAQYFSPCAAGIARDCYDNIKNDSICDPGKDRVTNKMIIDNLCHFDATMYS